MSYLAVALVRQSTDTLEDLAVRARVEDCMQACTGAMYVLTAPGVPAEVYIEEVIAHIVQFIKRQIQRCIFDFYDPAALEEQEVHRPFLADCVRFTSRCCAARPIPPRTRQKRWPLPGED